MEQSKLEQILFNSIASDAYVQFRAPHSNEKLKGRVEKVYWHLNSIVFLVFNVEKTDEYWILRPGSLPIPNYSSVFQGVLFTLDTFGTHYDNPQDASFN
jgi:hypothetical protein